MARDIRTKAHLQGGEIRTKANFGQTVKVTVSPDPYMGDTEVTPSAETQVLATKKKFVQDDITVLPAPTETLSTTSNGTFTPSSGKVGFSQVDVNVVPDLRPLSVSENGSYQPDGFDGFSQVSVDVPATGYDKGTLIYEGDFTATTSEWNVKTLPDGSSFSFDKIIVEISHINGSTNGNWRNYWRSDLPMTGNHAQMVIIGSQAWRVDNSTDFDLTLTIEIDGAYINLLVTGQDNIDPTKAKAGLSVLANGGYDKITGYGWWFWALNAGAHIKITGYNRTS